MTVGKTATLLQQRQGNETHWRGLSRHRRHQLLNLVLQNWLQIRQVHTILHSNNEKWFDICQIICCCNARFILLTSIKKVTRVVSLMASSFDGSMDELELSGEAFLLRSIYALGILNRFESCQTVFG